MNEPPQLGTGWASGLRVKEGSSSIGEPRFTDNIAILPKEPTLDSTLQELDRSANEAESAAKAASLYTNALSTTFNSDDGKLIAEDCECERGFWCDCSTTRMLGNNVSPDDFNGPLILPDVKSKQIPTPATFKTPQKQITTSTTTSEDTIQARRSAGAKRPFNIAPESSLKLVDAHRRKRARTDVQFKKPLEKENPRVHFSELKAPPSPLFFSNTPDKRPYLPTRFSSSEAAAKMMSKTQGEEMGVKTVRLARGSLGSSSPPMYRNTSTPVRMLDERNSRPRTHSPYHKSVTSQPRNFEDIGITELLECDLRPTFVIDLTDPENYDPGPLHPAYVNPACRLLPEMMELFFAKPSPHAGQSRPLLDPNLTDLKAWVLTEPPLASSIEVGMPSHVDGTHTWTMTTLRKKLRIVAGSFVASSKSLSNGPSKGDIQPNGAFDSMASAEPSPFSKATSIQEALDYFSGAPLPGDGSIGSHTSPTELDPAGTVLPTVEAHVEVPVAEVASGNASITSSATHTRENLLEPNHMIGSNSEEWLLAAQAAGHVDSFGSSSTSDQDQSDRFFDWTRLACTDSLPPHIKFARDRDWGATALGPIHQWSPDLRQMCNLIMASPHPAAMYWGEDLVAIYNEAYVLLAGQKHPKLMGQSYREAWAEIWDEVKDVFAGAQNTGQATMKDDDCLFIKRNDFLEETYFSWSIIPLVGEDGTVRGLYNPAFEKTRRKIAERRMLTLREVGERTAMARDQKGFWKQVLTALECNEYDTPFVVLYSLGDEIDSDSSSSYSNSFTMSKQCYLEGAVGVPDGHDAAPEMEDLKGGTQGFIPFFREVLKTNRPKLLDVDKGEIPPNLLDGLEPRGFSDQVKSVIVCPVHPTTDESTLGFLVMGINPRRPFDEDYSLFVQLLSRQLATSLASVLLFEKEIRRGQKAAKLAALDRIELSEQLAARTQEAIESETRFTRMAEFAPVGMFIAGSDGRISYCNDTWYEISRVPKETHSTDKWMDYVFDEDKTPVRELWHDLVKNTQAVTAEFRFKAPWTDQHGTLRETWVLFSAYPEKHEDGSLKSVFGSITNISQQKWAEGFQKRKTEEAIELKRQQENFIDITSHEMRNPLSAILQCADEIVASLSEVRNQDGKIMNIAQLNENIDAAQTITLCAQHQKRIVDDVLTMSKLDSALLMVTPVAVQPITVVQRALKMFEGELQTADITMEFNVDPSFAKLKVDWVKFDPSRVLQILINLVTNSIKFTTTRSKRTISVRIGATKEKPRAESETNVVNYFPSRAKRVAAGQGQDWGDGEDIYIHFAVQDTGRGLTAEEMKLLFLRFSQASPRTHVQYGGSGLGLFISRELAELQGGEIGVASEAGKG